MPAHLGDQPVLDRRKIEERQIGGKPAPGDGVGVRALAEMIEQPADHLQFVTILINSHFKLARF